MKKIIFLFLIFLVFNFTFSAIVTCRQEPCGWSDLFNTLKNLVGQLVIISYWIAVLLSVIGAFLMMLHGPSPSLYNKGKDLIKIAIFGFIFILLSGIIFDIILDFFGPKIKTTSIPKIEIVKFVFAEEAGVYYNPLRDALTSYLRCGQNAKPIFNSQALGRLFACLFEAINLLKNIALILLGFAILVSGGYLISAPVFGFEKIGTAKTILIWSTIGFIIILVADIIRSQIEILTR